MGSRRGALLPIEHSMTHPDHPPRAHRGRVVGVAVAAVGIVVALGAFAVGTSVDSEPTVAPPTTPPENPLDRWATTASSAAPSTTVGPQLPQPENPPTDPYENVAVVEIGTIRIPKIGLVHPVYEGVWLTVIDNGPGHWPGSAAPGGYGNAVFGGHRVTHSRPFRNVDQLVAGDEVIFDTSAGTFTYRVREVRVVQPEETWIVDQTPGHRLTLFACHPPGSAAQRIVVFGDLVTG